MNAFWAVMRNEITQLYRDKWYLLLMTVGAMSILIVMAYTLSTDIKNIPTVIVNLDHDYYSRQFIQKLSTDNFFTLSFVENRNQAEKYLQTSQAKIVIIIPSNYSYRIRRSQTVKLQALVDGSEPNVAELARTRLVAYTANTSHHLLTSILTQQGISPPMLPEFRPRIYYNPDLKTIISVLPGLMAIVSSVSAVGAAAAFARERERGNFELLISTPLGRWPLLLGRVFPYLLLGLLDICIFVLFGVLAFNIPIQGNLLLFIGMALLYLFAITASGVFIAQFLSSQHAAMIITFMLFGIAPTYLADLFFPLITMPKWLQQTAALMPATHFTIVGRTILLKGVGWQILWPNALTLFTIGTLMSFLAYSRFQKKLG